MKKATAQVFNAAAQKKAHRYAMKQAFYLILFIAAVVLACYSGAVVFAPTPLA